MDNNVINHIVGCLYQIIVKINNSFFCSTSPSIFQFLYNYFFGLTSIIGPVFANFSASVSPAADGNLGIKLST